MDNQTENPTYWLNTPLLMGDIGVPNSGGVLIIGGGLSGVSCAYWLDKLGMGDITIVDYAPEQAASYRNCGHILYGCVESFEALKEFHGEKLAAEVQHFSVEVCHEVRNTINEISTPKECEYLQSGYHVISVSEAEQKEIESSAKALNDLGYKNDLLNKKELESLGFKNTFGGRYEHGSAKAHPVKFRNALLKHQLNRQTKYFHGAKVTKIVPKSEKVEIVFSINDEHKAREYDAIVICANAYSPLFSDFFDSRKLIEPFKGQIITSAPLKHNFSVKNAHSFEHGYQYGLITEDNRLMIGGWRNNTPTGEIGSYDLSLNENVEQGLRDFVEKHYMIEEKVNWDYSWSGIMATSKTGLPFIGPTNHPLVFTSSGFTGHGFSWAHGSAKLCAQIMMGESIPDIASIFNPCK
jgi:glycine/D-amino acid oxidase-like deaminating enzyme